jgi:hypothetical protein
MSRSVASDIGVDTRVRHSQPATDCSPHYAIAVLRNCERHSPTGRRRSRSPVRVARLRTPGEVLHRCAPSGVKLRKPLPSPRIMLGRLVTARDVRRPTLRRAALVEVGDAHSSGAATTHRSDTVAQLTAASQ